jgi:iron complex transport system substrate-binding protein
MASTSRSQGKTAAVALVAAVGIGSYWYVCHRRRLQQQERSRQKQSFRIVSLCPSTTMTLYDLCLAHCVVGRTRYCENPPKEEAEVDGKSVAVPKVGGTKDPNWDKIRALNPSHILFNMEENDYTHLSIAQSICKTVIHTPVNIEESIQMILDLGQEFGTQYQSKAQSIVDDIRRSLSTLKDSSSGRKPFSFLYFIWHMPADQRRVAGKGTYIDAMLSAAGGTNLASQINDERYPLMPDDFDQVADYCLLSTEPFRYKESHFPTYQGYGRDCRIIDGHMISWHGSSTAKGLRYLVDYFGVAKGT